MPRDQRGAHVSDKEPPDYSAADVHQNFDEVRFAAEEHSDDMDPEEVKVIEELMKAVAYLDSNFETVSKLLSAPDGEAVMRAALA